MELVRKFTDIFGGTDEDVLKFHAPGRVNLIGEHIDYNGGYVLPCAISMGTYALFRKRGDDIARFASTDFDGVVEISVRNISFEKLHGWANYPKGIVHFVQQEAKRRGKDFFGFDVLFSGNIPNGAGLSSSASLEMVMASALNTAFSLGFEMIDLVKIAQKSENEFCGVNCGIMDMFAVGLGKKDFAIYLHCGSLAFEYVPMNLREYKIVIMDTNKRRKLNESKYNERRAECEKALAILGGEFLADLTPKVFEARAGKIQDEIIRKRAKHVVYENFRVKQATEALKTGDMSSLGVLLTESHNSLRDDYEVSCLELDTIVAEALKIQGCAGARMTGAGFGGCAIALAKQSAIQSFTSTVSENYKKIIGYAPSLYVQESG